MKKSFVSGTITDQTYRPSCTKKVWNTSTWMYVKSTKNKETK